MGLRSVDLNADLGESFGSWRMGDDAAMLSAVTSANIACGFHAGDPLTLRTVLSRAAEAGVSVGAHVAYPDLAGFGRRFLDCSVEELIADVLYQLSALDGLARSAGVRVSYVKPHGALYHAAIAHPAHARALAEATAEWSRTAGRSLPLLLPPGSLGHREAEALGVPTVSEAFADRAYRSDGTLVPRAESGAVIQEPAVVVERVVRLAREGVVTATDGSPVEVRAASICLHGDTPGAVALAKAVRAGLEQAGVRLAPFAREGSPEPDSGDSRAAHAGGTEGRP